MWRFLKRLFWAVMVLAALVLGFIAVDQGLVPPRGDLRNGALTTALGLVLGLAVARLRRVDWLLLPMRLRAFRHSAANLAAWTALGCASLAVLLYY